eukprot:5279179-Lingulodinium_polyedra.AAC.1
MKADAWWSDATCKLAVAFARTVNSANDCLKNILPSATLLYDAQLLIDKDMQNLIQKCEHKGELAHMVRRLSQM